MKMILCLDLGTTTGFALISADGGQVVSGCWELNSTARQSWGMKFHALNRLLVELHDKTPIDCIFYEEVRRHAGTTAAHVYGGLLGVVLAFCEGRELAYQGVPVGTLKKFWTSKGDASKPQMVATARLYGYEPEDDNEADAIALAHYAVSTDAERRRYDNMPKKRKPAKKPREPKKPRIKKPPRKPRKSSKRRASHVLA